MGMNTLQNIVMPDLNVCTEELLYFRSNSHSHYDYHKHQIQLFAGGEVNFNTYFNQFSVDKWFRFTTVDNISLVLEYAGEGTLRLSRDKFGHSHKVIAQHTIQAASEDTAIFPLPDLGALDGGLVSFKVNTNTSLLLKSAKFVTSHHTVNEVVLGISITAFKRDEYVLPAIKRLDSNLLSKYEFRDRIRLTVVDNGGTLTDKKITASCRLIQNKNLGGSGGFARGLFHYDKEIDDVTHCLFMDDDASCEIEAIKRTLALLSFARNSDLAIAGAMLLEKMAFMQHENGAKFDKRCISLKHNFDLRDPGTLMANDTIEPIGYGAWWYFAFPIKQVKNYPFPYFVRGDDVLFSMTNDFNIITLNGIASWQESFELKSSPLTLYLDIRSHISHYLLTDKLGRSVWSQLVLYWYFFMKNNVSYHYSTAEAVCKGLEDALSTTRFWQDNMDMSDKLSELASLTNDEKLQEISMPTIPPRALHPESLLKKCIRYFSLNGHLVPTLLFRANETITKHEAPLAKKSYLAKEVTIYQYENGTGFTLKHNKARFFKNIFKAIKLSSQLLLQSNNFDQKSRALQQYMTSEYWSQQFSDVKTKSEDKINKKDAA